jgi:hypothetical protein
MGRTADGRRHRGVDNWRAAVAAPRSRATWAQSDALGRSSPRQLPALGIDLAADEAMNLLPDTINLDGPVPVARIVLGCCAQRRSLRVPPVCPDG